MKASSPKAVVIVGGVAGGARAATRVRRLGEDCEIIMLERGPHVSFANCGLPYFVGGEIAEQDSLLLQTPESLKARFNLDVRIKTEVIHIDRTTRRIQVRKLETGREYEQTYDALILSTGATPLRPPLPGIERPNHFVVRSFPDVERIMAWSKDCQRCRAVAGGGYIGLEMAEQLRHRGLLDVRNPDERAHGFIPRSTHIPLDELRHSLSELPRDREIIAYCQSGQRSYNATRILRQHGFKAANLSGGCRTFGQMAAATPG